MESYLKTNCQKIQFRFNDNRILIKQLRKLKHLGSYIDRWNLLQEVLKTWPLSTQKRRLLTVLTQLSWNYLKKWKRAKLFSHQKNKKAYSITSLKTGMKLWKSIILRLTDQNCFSNAVITDVDLFSKRAATYGTISANTLETDPSHAKNATRHSLRVETWADTSKTCIKTRSSKTYRLVFQLKSWCLRQRQFQNKLNLNLQSLIDTKTNLLTMANLLLLTLNLTSTDLLTWSQPRCRRPFPCL